MNDDNEPRPLAKVDIVCPDCALTATYPDWHQAPEPLRTYCQYISQREYGLPTEERSGEEETVL